LTKIDENAITSLSIGGFDGMHIAHQKLLNKLDKNGAIIVIQTKYQNLTPKKNRQKYTNSTCYYYNLKDIQHLDGKEFINVLVKRFKNLKKIVVGFDFKFGKNAKYQASDLKAIFKKEVVIVDEIKLNNISIHSKIIREKLTKGNIKIANEMLGRYYSIQGKAIKGLGIGNKEFVPTINIKCKKYLIPKNGVWLTLCKIKNAKKYGYKNIKYYSITFIGHRATIDNSFAIETHIISLQNTFFKAPKKITISFIDFLRDNKKFSSYEELKKQIELDIYKAKTYFNLNL